MTIFRSLFTAALFLVAAGAVGQSTTTGGVTYTPIDNTLTVTAKWNGAATVSDITIEPTVTINGESYTVTKIVASTEAGDANQLTSVTIKAENVEIADYAFYGCGGLKSVTLSGNGSIKSIGRSAFYNCEKLSSIDDIIKDLTEISDYAFFGCKAITEINTPTTLKTIGKQAFHSCTELTTLNLAEGLETIGEEAFRNDAKISSLILPATTGSIGKAAFYDNEGIEVITVPKSVKTIGEECFYNCAGLEKLYFEGGNLKYIPKRAFIGCNKLEEIKFGEGLTAAEDSAFSSCGALKTVTLPKTFNQFGERIFIGCNSLEAVYLYAAKTDEEHMVVFDDTFSDIPNTAKLYVPNVEEYVNAGWSDYFKGGIYEIFTFDEKAEGENKTITSGEDSESALDIFRALSDPNGDYYNANASMSADVTYAPVTLDLDTLSASNIFMVLDAIPYTDSYSGEMKGATITNLAARSTGLFGTIGAGSKIDGLVLNDAVIYVDPTDSKTYGTKGDSVFIHLLAKTNDGDVRFGFSGDIIVDDEYASGKEIYVCAIDSMGSEGEINGFVNIGNLLATGNTKRCITIKQNLGIHRPPGKKTKVATNKSLAVNKSATNKATTNGFYEYDEDELIKYVREFTDDEFASGAVAYWLNWSGPGYTGDFTGYWSQGKKVPVPATTISGKTNVLQLVDYGTTDMTHITSAKQFANNGSEITITYDQKPESVTIGGKPYTAFGDKSMTVTYEQGKAISISFNKSATALDEPAQKVSVSTSGLEITVSGAPAGSDIKLYSLTGKVMAATNGTQLTAPAQGLYVLRVDGKTYKVMLK